MEKSENTRICTGESPWESQNLRGEYCDVCGEIPENCTCLISADGDGHHIYILENLGCANCAAKMEAKIRELPGVRYASIIYTTKQLRVSANNHVQLLPEFQEICAEFEPEVRVVPRENPQNSIRTVAFTLENLGCANCAAKMENQIRQIDGITAATITFATGELRVSGRAPEDLLPQFQRICTDIERDVKIVFKDVSRKTPASTGNKISKNLRSGIEIGIGAVALVAGLLLSDISPIASIAVFIAGYIILGGRIVVTAARNILKGKVFDENFLMSLATLAAFALRYYEEALGVMLFYRVGELFERVAVQKSRSQIMDAVDMRPEVVSLVTGEEVRQIPAGDALVGDILQIRPGDRIPLDGVITQGESRIDTSPITGEPTPVKAGVGDALISGCVNTSGLLKMRVEKVLAESMVARILDSVENAAASKPKLDRFITRFARIYTPFVVLFALVVAVVPPLFTGDWHYWIYTAVTFLVISCPCALVLSVPLAFFSGIGAGSKRGILFKGGVALEALGKIKAVALDKTGTITKGHFVLQSVHPAGDITEDALLTLAACCELTSTHPIGHSIVNAANEKGLSVKQPDTVEEISGKGIRASVSQGEVLCGNRTLMDSFQIDLSAYRGESHGTEVLVAQNGVFIGHLVISDTIKEEAAQAIRDIKGHGITTAMLTGDAWDSARAVAEKAGVDEVHAKLLPEDKLTKLQEIRQTHGSVMFVGDGINDAPVLAGADVGTAMGSGADAAIEAADVVFITSSMEAVPGSISIARATGHIAMQNVVFSLIIKGFVMALGLMGYASMWMAVFADTGVAMLCVLNAMRILYRK